MHKLNLLFALGLFVSCVDVAEAPDEECNDRADNDLDGDTDCDDADCAGDSKCSPDPEICNDNQDNNGNNAVDCADAECELAANCAELIPEVCSLGSGDEDGDALADCQDPDCATATVCGSEICNNGIDDNGNLAIDCAEASCINNAACQAAPPENCTDNVDNDLDSKADCLDPDCANDPACAIATCDPADDLCTGDNICIGNTCQPAFGRNYTFSGFDVLLGGTDPSGGCWDPGCGTPDPKVQLFLNGNQFLDTDSQSGVFNAVFSETATAQVNNGDAFEIRILDDDGIFSAADPALSCTADPLGADFLRSRVLQCVNVVNINGSDVTIGDVIFQIQPN